MDSYCALTYVFLGIVLGTVGQGARAIIGIKKAYKKCCKDKCTNDWFYPKKLIFSLFIGAISGALGAVLLFGANIDKEFLIALVAIGYSGADFIEGFVDVNIK